ncbi:MAG: hypothetical protein HRU21_08500 [Pseudomonadales bacterium]|nr:hypothetical protein [Pseudomonadales bacterium]
MARISDKTKNLSQSGIRSASSRCAAVKGINLTDFRPPSEALSTAPSAEPIRIVG